MLRDFLAQLAVALIATAIGGHIYYRFFYKGNRRKPAYAAQHSYTKGRRPIVWIDWEEKFGDRILTFGATL